MEGQGAPVRDSPPRPGGRRLELAAEDLRDALLADPHHSGDRLLGKAAAVRSADLPVACGAQLLAGIGQLRLALCVGPRERR